MPTPIIKQCPKCKTDFFCNQQEIQNCSCGNLYLEAETLDFLENNFEGCLCNSCLVKINDVFVLANKLKTNPKSFVEGTHYYKEGGALVFTEFYHILRGFCCGNGCRHCPYGHKNC